MVVAGVSGSGKTTLAAAIGARLGIPHVEIDALFHGPGWTPRSEFVDDVRDLVARDSWVTEWQYGSARPLLGARAEVLVWLDVPFRVTLARVVRRTLRRRARHEVLWNGNTEGPLWTFFTDPEHIVRWAISTRHQYRERIPRLATEHPHLVVVRLRSQRERDRWLAHL